MKQLFNILPIVLLLLVVSNNKINAQADTLIKFCQSNMGKEYVSDGQHYMALLSKGEVAEFRTTFYSGVTYRVAACCGLENGNVGFTIYDTERHEIFSNQKHDNVPYWDLSFKSTTDCIIEGQIISEKLQSGVLILLIGFKPN